MPFVSPHNELEMSASGAWPAHFGHVKDEFAALKSTCGVYIQPDRARFRLTGSDRVRWLNGMTTNNIRDLVVGQGVYAFVLNPQGHILGDLTAYNFGDYLLVETEQAQSEKIRATFEHFIIMDDVEVANVSEEMTTIGAIGPGAGSILKAAGFEFPELKIQQVAHTSWQGRSVSVVRRGTEQYPAYEIWSPPGDADRICQALQSAGATRVGRDALELYRVALGVARYGQDIRERDLPQETGQEHALNFNKGCYIGQEIVERIRSRGAVHRKFTGFEVSGPAPAAGTKIQVQAKDVGEITSSAVVPGADRDHTLALGYIRRELCAGTEVDLGGSKAIITDLPFKSLLNI